MEPGSSPEALDPSRLLGRRVEAEHELDEEDGVVDRLANGPPDRLAGRAAHSRPDRGLGLLGHPLEGSRLRRLIDEPADVGGEGGELEPGQEPLHGHGPPSENSSSGAAFCWARTAASRAKLTSSP
jgi:hypothetical protein